ncbi:hypothetical protein H9P43_005685 [Blastocladiella emersonii ATCC 22665]|nr:hypothetical protein H9P43_005685 [Blastocladiella emersonii ATCC 22665]
MTNSPVQYFSGQVAGHDSLVQVSPAILAKPCVPHERQFYVDAAAAESPALAYLPAYLGNYPGARPAGIDTKGGKLSELIQLGNLLAGVRAPSVMDLKMGTQLYDARADDKKKQHMIELANATTNGSAGMRVSGMKLYTGAHGEGGIPVDDAAYVPYDKTFGKSLVADTVYQAFLEYTKHVAAADVRCALLVCIREELAKFLAVAETLDGVYVGTSLLFIFDAAPAAGSIVDSFRLHWIDFAHSDLSTGTGAPNEQFLFGVRNAIKAADKAMAEFAHFGAARTSTLRDLLVANLQLPPGSCIDPATVVLRPDDPPAYRSLLETTLVGLRTTAGTDSPPPPPPIVLDVCPAASGQWLHDSLSASGVLHNLQVLSPGRLGQESSLRDVVDRAIEWLMATGRQSDVLTLGFRLAPQDRSLNLARLKGIETVYPNHILDYAMRPEFGTLLSRVGDAFFTFLLTHTSMFVAVRESGSYMQVSGPQFSTVLRGLVSSGATPSSSASSSAARKRLNSAASAGTGRDTGSNKRLRAAKPSEITFTRAATLHARPRIGADNRVVYKLPESHPLNQPATLDALKPILPSEFESKRGRGRARLTAGFLPLWSVAVDNWARCRPHRLLAAIAPPPPRAPTLARHIPSSRVSRWLARHVPPACVARWLVAVSRAVFPLEVWGSVGNRATVEAVVHRFVELGAGEEMALHEAVAGIMTSEIAWLGSKTGGGKADGERRAELVRSWVAWYLGKFVVPLIKTYFYVTATQPYRKSVFYFPHPRAPQWWHPLRVLPKLASTRVLVSHARRLKLMPAARGRTRVHGTRFHVRQVRDAVFPLQRIAVQRGIVTIHAVKVDVVRAYDSIDPERALQVAGEIMEADTYVTRTHDVVFPSGKVATHRSITPLSKLSKFHKYAAQQNDQSAAAGDAVYVDNVVHAQVRRDTAARVMHEMVATNAVRVGKQYFMQKHGIPQGAPGSAMLCNVFYGEMEQKHLGFIAESGAGTSLLVRFIDDFLLLTRDAAVSTRFLDTMARGIPEYGCTIALPKSVATFAHPGGVLVRDVVPWCGLLVDTTRRVVVNDYERFVGQDLSSTMQIDTRKPGAKLASRASWFLTSKLHSVLFDLDVNDAATVLLNAYQLARFAALKLTAYLVQLSRRGVVVRSAVVLRAVKELVTAFPKLLARCTRRYHLTTQRKFFKNKSVAIKWLAMTAYAESLSLRREHAKVCQELHKVRRRVQHVVPAADRAVASDPRNAVFAQIRLHP